MKHKTSVLVVGGAGFIGSHMVKLLGQESFDITVLDNLSSGHEDAILFGDFVFGDANDKQLITDIIKSKHFDVVMHFASSIDVAESVIFPNNYYRNNLINTLNLLDVMIEQNVKRFIFSSTAAIFGEPKYTPIDESHPKNPINPYGRSKLMVEEILDEYNKAFGLNYVCLRYFNAAGADPDGQLGERHIKETHLIPLILQAASGRREEIYLNGCDYDTKDGTCVRDYIHVTDLCHAHLLGINYLMNTDKPMSLNLGNGEGFSVKEVIDMAKKVTQVDFKVVERGRREGDPAILIADSSLAIKELGWKPKYQNLNMIIDHAWKFETDFLAVKKI